MNAARITLASLREPINGLFIPDSAVVGIQNQSMRKRVQILNSKKFISTTVAYFSAHVLATAVLFNGLNTAGCNLK
jgi:hypothetical protein